jgi:hypothetical protein
MMNYPQIARTASDIPSVIVCKKTGLGVEVIVDASGNFNKRTPDSIRSIQKPF